jgi:hypothetical protein
MHNRNTQDIRLEGFKQNRAWTQLCEKVKKTKGSNLGNNNSTWKGIWRWKLVIVFVCRFIGLIWANLYSSVNHCFILKLKNNSCYKDHCEATRKVQYVSEDWAKMVSPKYYLLGVLHFTNWKLEKCQ